MQISDFRDPAFQTMGESDVTSENRGPHPMINSYDK